MKSVLQDWVMELGLRHQGVLLTAVRGCDTSPKNDASKMFIRSYRAKVLNCHCGDPRKAATFIEEVGLDGELDRFRLLRKNVDHLPHHYLMHLIHAIEIVGYKHPDQKVREQWSWFYYKLVHGLHLVQETEEQLDQRLNADEAAFAARDWTCDGPPRRSTSQP